MCPWWAVAYALSALSLDERRQLIPRFDGLRLAMISMTPQRNAACSLGVA